MSFNGVLGQIKKTIKLHDRVKKHSERDEKNKYSTLQQTYIHITQLYKVGGVEEQMLTKWYKL